MRIVIAMLITLAFAPVAFAENPHYKHSKFDSIKDNLYTGKANWDFSRMNSIHYFVNKLVKYEDDPEDIWQPPSQTLNNKTGDCEDIVFLKYAIARELGLVQPGSTNIVIVLDKFRDNKPHMLLILRDVVYDNQYKDPFWITDSEMRRYQVVGNLDMEGR